MRNMDGTNFQETRSVEELRQDRVYREAIAKINAGAVKKTAGGYAVMVAAQGYGEAALGKGTFGKTSHAAKLFCIGFAFLLPSLLIWRVVL